MAEIRTVTTLSRKRKLVAQRLNCVRDDPQRKDLLGLVAHVN